MKLSVTSDVTVFCLPRSVVLSGEAEALILFLFFSLKLNSPTNSLNSRYISLTISMEILIDYRTHVLIYQSFLLKSYHGHCCEIFSFLDFSHVFFQVREVALRPPRECVIDE